jgi:transcriptional regulator with XRE-family HTH domain
MAFKKVLRPEDVIIGRNLKRIRHSKGWGQERLGAALKLTFQQVQKYEKGTNGMRGSRIADVCRVLNVPLEALYRGIDLIQVATYEDPLADFGVEQYASEFVRAYHTLDEAQRVRILRAFTRILQSMKGEHYDADNSPLPPKGKRGLARASDDNGSPSIPRE